MAMALPSPAGNDIMLITSYASDSATESCWRRHHRGDFVVTRCIYRVMLAMMLPSHAGDSAAGATWPRRDVDVESC
jgi:hypothetical protein